MFSFLFEGRMALVTAFSGITENSTEEEKREFCGRCLDSIHYVTRHGGYTPIDSGCLNHFIYYEDNGKFFDQHKEIILDYFEEWYDDSFLDCMKKELELRDIIECNLYAKNYYVTTFVNNAVFAREWEFEEAIKEYDNQESNE